MELFDLGSEKRVVVTQRSTVQSYGREQFDELCEASYLQVWDWSRILKIYACVSRNGVSFAQVGPAAGREIWGLAESDTCISALSHFVSMVCLHNRRKYLLI
jgi:hypothetical protein